MGSIPRPPAEQARSIFEDLGYEIIGSGAEFSAARDWKEVRVSAVEEAPVGIDGGRYRCFVTWAEHTEELAAALRREDPAFEWAVIGVSEDGEYEVARAPPVA